MTNRAFLDHAAPIVNPVDGRVTPYFQRFWQNLNITTSVTLKRLEKLEFVAVRKGADAVPWALPPLPPLSHNFSLYTAPVIATPLPQVRAQVQDLANAVQALNRNMLTVIVALRAAGLVA